MANLREQIEAYTKRVKDLADRVKGNEQATKQSLIGPFFTMLGYDLTDPRECIPEFKADFGKDRSSKPIDWAFLNNDAFAMFVEAKEVGRKLAGFDEQLADYFAKKPEVKVGILTNGAQWRFFTDVVNPNVMDNEPFAKWDIFADDPPPFDVITLLQKSSFNAELIRAFAQRQRAQNLLVRELAKLLEPSTEFTKHAVANIETRNLTQAVVESWKPVVASALDEWARQRMLTAALSAPQAGSSQDGNPEPSKVVTTVEEVQVFTTISNLLGPERTTGYEDTVSYFKIHVAGKRTWVFARLQLGRRNPLVWVPLPMEQATPLVGDRPISTISGWSVVTLEDAAEVADLRELFRTAYAWVMRERGAAGTGDDQ